MTPGIDIHNYIHSGILEAYCLGVLSTEEKKEVESFRLNYTEVHRALSAIELSFEHLAEATSIQPPASLKEQIWQTILASDNDQNIDLSNPPVINRFSDHTQWLNAVAPFIPGKISEERYSKVLYASPTMLQILIVTQTDIEPELHDNLRESFIILEGECECYIGNKVIRLQAGGFTDIPLHTTHDVKLISHSVTAILQRIAV